MEKMQIGYKLKYKDLSINGWEKFLHRYSEFFNYFELKIDRRLIKMNEIYDIIKISKNIMGNNFSFHIMKNIILDKNEEENLKNFLMEVRRFNDKDSRMYVSHFLNEITYNNIVDIQRISSMLLNNDVLLLENIKVKNSENYLNNMEYIISNIYEKNIAVCLDFGHLLCGANYKDRKEILKRLAERKRFLSKIKEIHIHDFTIKKDHLILGEGNINLKEIMEFLIKNDIHCPIIIENNVQNINNAIIQVEKIKKTYEEDVTWL